MRRRSPLPALGFIAALLSLSPRSEAEGNPDSEHARALFRAARELAAAGDYDTACKKFEESLKLDSGIGTKFNLADCYEHSSRPLAAKSLFLDVADRSHENGQLDREKIARERAAALGSAIPKLIIDVKVATEKLELRRDGVVVEPKSWGAEVEVELGKHHIEASAPGRKAWSSDVAVAAEKKAIVVEVPELEKDAPEAAKAKEPEPKEEEAPKEEAPKPAEEAPPRTENNTVPILLYSGIGVGVVLAATSLIIYKTSNDKAKGICPTSVSCTTDEVNHHTELVRDAQTARSLAYLGFGVAGASAIAYGIYTLSRTPAKDEKPATAGLRATPFVGPFGAGATVDGTF